MKECIVLAGGLGTRLRSSIGEYPKCMADVGGKPFLQYLNQFIQSQQIERVIYSVGYKHEVIIDWLNAQQVNFTYDFAIEEEPLGTGGGIQLAMHKALSEDVIVLNGDTMFLANLNSMMQFYRHHNAEVTIALKQMYDFNRYGVVKTEEKGVITAFEEKKTVKQGWINGGIYIINKQRFLARGLSRKFSFETDYLQRFVAENTFYGFQSEEYFIDIGIPEDYSKAQTDFEKLFS